MTTSEAHAVCKRNGVNVAHGSLLAQEIAPVLLQYEQRCEEAAATIEQQVAAIARLQTEVQTGRYVLDMSLAENQRLRATMDGMLAEFDHLERKAAQLEEDRQATRRWCAEAVAVIKEGVKLMTLDQLSAWAGVRGVLETAAIDGEGGL